MDLVTEALKEALIEGPDNAINVVTMGNTDESDKKSQTFVPPIAYIADLVVMPNMESLMIADNSKSKPNLILDLDETLIHAVQAINPEVIGSYSVQENFLFHFKSGPIHYIIFYRPFMFEFLRYLSEVFNIYIFTNASRGYAEKVIFMITSVLGFNPIKKFICRTNVPNTGMKYLRYFKGTDINSSNSVIIDDLNVWPEDFSNQIFIKQFMGPENPSYLSDNHLSVLYSLLHGINIKYFSSTDHIINHIISARTDYEQTFTQT